MRKVVLIWLCVIGTMSSYALHVRNVGKAALLVNDDDTLFVFEQHPRMEVVNLEGEVCIYQYPDSNKIVFQSDRIELNNEFDLEHGQGYLLKKDDIREVFWAFDYQQLRPLDVSVTAELLCENTILTLNGEIPEIRYVGSYGQERTYPRTCHITHLNAAWDATAEMWADSTSVEEMLFEAEMVVGASPVVTDYQITFSDDLAQRFGTDTLYSLIYEPVALKANPVTITTTRGTISEPSNEVNRPYTKDDVLNMSAPLEVLFKANGLNADYYEWKLYKGSDLMLMRNDAEHRYTFTDKGHYRAVVVASNANCVLDSVEFTISISESMLRVPNVFTPNGDGANDEFRVAYRSLKEFHCWVYNRWGHLVYEWTDPAKGWDGTINGRPAAEGAYFYVIRALGTDADENSKYMMKPVYKKKVEKQDESILGVYQLSGSINLLRGGK